ncbi:MULTISPECIES: DNA polymerase I [unclassified Fibrobacter]|uniref:DNA polymerase I n=1 Tax=unclassified Fibrobacter TaxID=2634177 RepID=UPI000917CB96|nr:MULTISPECIES: DNA polymerase I [Fibrobacter]MCL4101435.1 DNA polymerase I [Fibrobacter succinogenes]OWV07566.1 DNA polymerase I [Fibrobacter sp. UWH3]SHK60176.1 DNA polymerase I [Fibrobacter sp. UWH6]
MAEKTLLLLDSYALAFRMFYAYSQNPLKNSAGEDVSMMHGYWGAVLRILAKHKPTHFAIARDVAHTKTFRHELYPDYKANRGPMPEEMAAQMPLLGESLEASGIPLLSEPGYEADDVMASTAVAAAEAGFDHVLIISKDKDMSQIVNEKIHLFHLEKGADGIDFGPEQVLEKYGLPPEKIRDYLALMGDASDNVPGVPKVGPKTAITLLEEYGDMDNIYANIDNIKKKGLHDNLANNKEQAFLSRELVTLQTKRAFNGNLDALEYNGIHVDTLADMFKEHEINSLLRLLEKVPSKTGFVKPADADNAADETTGENKEVIRVDFDLPKDILPTYICVDSTEIFEQMKAEFAAAPLIGVDTETDGLDPMQCGLVGLCLSADEAKGYYIPLNHHDEIGFPLPVAKGANFDINAVKQWFVEIFSQDESAEVQHTFVFHNAKFDLHVLARAFDLTLQQIEKANIIDTLIAAWMLSPGENGLGLDNQVMQRLQHEMIPIENLIGRGKNQITFDRAPIPQATEYGAEDAVYTLRLWAPLQKQLQKYDYEKYFYQQEMPMLKVLYQMETVGIAVDVPSLKTLEYELQRRIENLEKEICDMAGCEFNIGSPKQLAEVLFDTLGMRQVKKRSTDAAVLEELFYETASPFIAAILEYRELKKMQSTYISVLPTLVNPETRRIHTSFVQWGTATGRLSSRDPNLQNIPVRSELGKKIRAAFVPQDPENVILAVDYSQIELRMLAHLSGDEALIDSYRNNIDIHARTAAAIYGVPLENVTSDMRRDAKVVNFGVLYGMTAFRLSRDLKIPMGQAKDFITGYFDMFQGVQMFIESTKANAHRDGYVETLTGRRRYIAGIDSSDRMESQMAERMAVNTPVQGSAADLIKIAMIRIQKRINDEALPLRMMLQVHDELVFECPRDRVDELSAMVKSEMENAMKLQVPLVASVGFGENWLIAH